MSRTGEDLGERVLADTQLRPRGGVTDTWLMMEDTVVTLFTAAVATLLDHATVERHLLKVGFARLHEAG
jgi:hypothetical protein